MVPIISLLILAVLSLKFLAIRAYVTFNLLLFGIGGLIAGYFRPDYGTLIMTTAGILLVIGIVFLLFTIRKVEPSERGSAVLHFILYGLCLYFRVLFFCTLIFIPVALMVPSSSMREIVDADLESDYSTQRKERQMREEELKAASYKKYGARDVELNRDGTMARHKGGEWVSIDSMEKDLYN